MSKASPPKKPSGSKYVINFELKELKKFEEIKTQPWMVIHNLHT